MLSDEVWDIVLNTLRDTNSNQAVLDFFGDTDISQPTMKESMPNVLIKAKIKV